ncbi:MAG: hypothetical protein AB7P76_07960 [Candidatus Melainabacteria bacterium]
MNTPTGPFLTDNYRRWYDQETAISELLRQIRDIGERTIRDFCADLVHSVAEQVRRQIHAANEKGVTSIGLPGIEALYQFKTRQDRWYDQHPRLQRAVGTLYTLPREGLVAFAFSLGDAIGLLSVYGKVCDDLGEQPRLQDLSDIARTAMNDGSIEGMRILRSIIGPDLFDVFYPNALLDETPAGHDPNAPRGSNFYLESRLD